MKRIGENQPRSWYQLQRFDMLLSNEVHGTRLGVHVHGVPLAFSQCNDVQAVALLGVDDHDLMFRGVKNQQVMRKQEWARRERNDGRMSCREQCFSEIRLFIL